MAGRIGSTVLFTIFMPGLAMVYLPAWVLSASGGARDPGAVRYAGAIAMLAGLAVLFWCFAGFIVEGQGTPAPYDAPRNLVRGRLYRWVRNPMYVAVLTVVVGEAAVFGSAALLVYAAALWLTFHLFVTLYEEPGLRARFGASYDAYLTRVPRWIPRRPVPQY